MATINVDFFDLFVADVRPSTVLPLPSSVAIRIDPLFMRSTQSDVGAVRVDGVFSFATSVPTTNPAVVSAEVVDANTVDVIFDREMIFDAVMLDLTSWLTDDPRLTVQAVKSAGAYRARLTLSEMRGSQTYKITAPEGARSTEGLELDLDRLEATIVGLGRLPRVAGIELLSETRLRIRFDERMRDDGALRSAQSYAIAPTTGGAPVFVGAAVPETVNGEIRSVVIAMTEQTNGGAYAITVSGDVVDYIGNSVDPSFSTVAFTGRGVAPAVMRIDGLSANRLDVFFTEPIRRNPFSLATSTYTFNNGLSVLGVLAVDGNKVSLVTSPQTPGTTYTLSIGS